MRILLLCSFIFSTTFLQAQYTYQLSNAKQQAQIMANAMVKKDYATVIKYSNPTVVKGMGGAEKMKTQLPELDKKMGQSGVSVKSINIGEILSIVKVKNEFICSLLQTTQMKMQIGIMQLKGTIIGISNDNGVTWTFTEATGRDRNDLKKIMPNLNDKVVIAKREEPKLLPQQ
jgi:hypothetical protein